MNAALTSVLGRATKPAKAPAKKGKVPEVETDLETRVLAAHWRERKEASEAVAKELADAAESLLSVVTPLREEICRQGHVPSVRVPTSTGENLLVTWAARYSNVGKDAEYALRAQLGDRYENLFEEVLTVKVKTSSKEVLATLVEAFGADRFVELFEVERSVKPTPRFTAEQYWLSEPVRALVTSVAPSIRA